MIETVRGLGIAKPIEIWELNHRYIDQRPYDDTEHADEAARLLITAAGEGSAWTIYTNYFDHLDNSNYGLVDGAGAQRAAWRVFDTVSAELSAARTATPLEMPAGAHGYRFETGDGERIGAWTDGGEIAARRELGISASTAAVTSLERTTDHVRLADLRLGPRPVFIAPDQLVISKPSRHAGRITIRAARPRGSLRRRCAGRLRVIARHHRSEPLATGRFVVYSGHSAKLRLRADRAGRPRRVTAIAKACEQRRCTSWYSR